MDASGARYRFGALSRITAEAIGEPGHRTFRLILESGPGLAYLWLEKEQLYQLAVYIQEIIASLSSKGATGGGEVPEPQWDGGVTTVDFKIGKLALGLDSSTGCFLLLAHDVEESEETTPTLSFWLTVEQGERISEEALRVCAAGRPKCFLCGQPINPEGHMCPRANGHATLES